LKSEGLAVPRLPNWSLVRRVLLVRLRSIGDTVLMTPCLTAIKEFCPQAQITAVMEPLAAPLIEDHPLVDELLVVESSLRSRARVVAQLRRNRFDVAFNLHGGTTATMMIALSGARHTVGFAGHRQSWLLSIRAPGPDVILGRETIHSVEQQLTLLHWAGVPYPSERPRLALSVSDDTRTAVEARLKAIGLGAFAAIAPGAAVESKRWPAARFADVVDHLAEFWKLPSVVIGGPGQEAVAHEVADRANSRPPVVTGLDLKELMALLAAARLYIGNDSGPTHIAAAFDRPMVVVFGSSDQTVWRPWTDSPWRAVGPEGSDEAVGVTPHAAMVAVRDVIRAIDEVVESAVVAGCWDAS
jgi:ADP-heptose:LPS heptosyltransferase